MLCAQRNPVIYTMPVRHSCVDSDVTVLFVYQHQPVYNLVWFLRNILIDKREREMASDEHICLANKIKSVHLSLRLRAREVGASEAWQEHCKQSEKLQDYAACMKELATTHWDKAENASRISWVVNHCNHYYKEGGYMKELSREVTLCEKLGIKPNISDQELTTVKFDKPKLLDVGSCYNPFGRLGLFDVLAIDLAPACSEVLQSDFLSISICKTIPDRGIPITQLQAESFDIVVFSLLLEYLPCSEQRYECCKKAADLLSPGGLLFIITPDSKHATANSGIMKRWRFALATLGLARQEYEKLPHLHCMVFRKCYTADVAIKWVSQVVYRRKSEKDELLVSDPRSLMVIPQDFNNYENIVETGESKPKCDRNDFENTIALFENLPDL